MDATLEPVVDHVDTHDPGGVVGLYLFGSSVTTGLRPDSDIDLLLVTRRTLTEPERASLTSLLLSVSGWDGHRERFPDAVGRRPVELTSILLTPPRPARPTQHRDYQYGEWLRADLLDGDVPQPVDDPDVIVLIATALTAHRALRGPALESVTAPIPGELLATAAVQTIPQLLRDLPGDERNVLLTLARIVVTVETGRIVAKDAAARDVAATLPAEERELLLAARAEHLGEETVGWPGHLTAVERLARVLTDRARRQA